MKRWLSLLFHIYWCIFLWGGDASQGLAQQAELPSYFSPHKKLSQYVLTHWTTEEIGASYLYSVHCSSDGFVWMTSYSGLVRFDGHEFEIFDPLNTPEIPSLNVYGLAESPDSTLWITTHKGFSKYKNGHFENVGESLNFTHPTKIIYCDSKGRIWLGTLTHGLFIYEPSTQKLRKIPVLSSDDYINHIKEIDGKIWICAENAGLLVLEDEKIKQQYKAPDNIIFQSIHKDKFNTIYISGNKGLMFLKDGQIVFDKKMTELVWNFFEDTSGLWMISPKGIYRKNYETNQLEHDLKDEYIRLAADKEGNLWLISKQFGLYRLKDGIFTSFSKPEGVNLKGSQINTFYEIDQQVYAVGMNAKTYVFSRHHSLQFLFEKPSFKGTTTYDICQNKNNIRWRATYGGLVRDTPKESAKLLNEKNGYFSNTFRCVIQDQKGNVWAGSRTGGLLKIPVENPNNPIQYIDKQGLSSPFIMSLAEDKSGQILVGTNTGGLNILTLADTFKVIRQANGLSSDLILDIYCDEDNITWIATKQGLNRLEGNQITVFTRHEGLPYDVIYQVIEDAQKMLWLATDKGLVRVSKQALNDQAHGKRTPLNPYLYTKEDGLKTSAYTGLANAFRASDGSLWFPMQNGISIIYPDKIKLQTQFPEVQLKSFMVDKQEINLKNKRNLVLESGSENISFRWRLSILKNPQKIKLRYRLIGTKTGWIENPSKRDITYTSLAPKKYTFQINISNEQGDWNPEITEIKFYIAPFFWQTIWFWGLVIVVLFILTLIIFRWRSYRIIQRNKQLEWLVKQRTEEISVQKSELEKINGILKDEQTKIKASINYAERIQKAVLPPKERIQKHLSDLLIFHKPRDVVSGDFYWFAEVQPKFRNTQYIMVVADCTGHGVPGAFMSLIGNNLLDYIVNTKQVIQPNLILTQTHHYIQRLLNQAENEVQDGMDAAVCVIDKRRKEMTFSGAKRPLIMIENQRLQEIKGDSFSVGGYFLENYRKDYTSKKILFNKDTQFYLFSDGYADQLGGRGKRDKKFMTRRLKRLLLEISSQTPDKQRLVLEEKHYKWRQDKYPQTDDILVVGFKIKHNNL